MRTYEILTEVPAMVASQSYEVKAVLEPVGDFSPEEVTHSVKQMADMLGWDISNPPAGLLHRVHFGHEELVIIIMKFPYDKLSTERQRDDILKRLRRRGRGKPRFSVLSIEILAPETKLIQWVR